MSVWKQAARWLAGRDPGFPDRPVTRDTNASGRSHPVPRSLEGRIVICANCDAKTTLYTSSSGSLVCGVCSSPSWLFEIPCRLDQLVNSAEEIRQLQHLYSLMPNVLPIDLREEWVADVKRRAEVRVKRAGGSQ